MDEAQELVLVVEDERTMARILATGLQARNYRVTVARTGQDALDDAAAEDPDVIVLDLRLPDIDGVEVCRRIRTFSTTPIIVVTADGAEQRKIQALDEGADDYVTKPFSMPELLARIRVALRHRQAIGRPPDDSVYEVGDLVVDTARRRVRVRGTPVQLTPKEFDLLAVLARFQGKVVTHRALLSQVWGPEAIEHTEYLRTYANQLRNKLGDDPEYPRLLTEPGVGYRLIATDESSAG